MVATGGGQTFSLQKDIWVRSKHVFHKDLFDISKHGETWRSQHIIYSIYIHMNYTHLHQSLSLSIYIYIYTFFFSLCFGMVQRVSNCQPCTSGPMRQERICVVRLLSKVQENPDRDMARNPGESDVRSIKHVSQQKRWRWGYFPSPW